ncbi:uncharacterized protein K02A2.6-like [Metopolophium dirhodum]|uniref:uncharacterized protein K02A2.6-like n=1 Tax=Metopolophium dirhodum TaxID=44670 RepID=UPI00298F7492|nr:uncharacterized protein K02A2.6-like [Metopolophium dirhodum]
MDKPSEWANNLVVVQKPDSSLRICLDPKELNNCLLREQYSVPTLEEITPKLINKKYYIVFDLRDGYYHIKLDEKSTPELFMKQNEKYFGDIEGVIIYFDDILIAADSIEQHEQIMNKIQCGTKTEEHKKILDTIKSLISEKSLLVHFNANKPVHIQCDASKKAIACCLLQEDLLTRNIIYKEEKDDESLRDLIHTVKVAEIKYSTEKLSELKSETNNDTILKRVIDYYVNGWPNQLKEENEINHYYKIKVELTVEEGLVYFNNRVVIPRVLRGEMLRRIHESHQGIEKSK